MASSRIHQDQENRIPDLRQKQSNNAMAAQQKRPALGAIHNNKIIELPPKGKQPLKEVKSLKPGDENARKNKNLVAPIVPVAQFEAFKVYEDEEYVRIENKMRMDKFITKTELAEMQQKKIAEEKMKQISEIPHCLAKAEMIDDAHMSIEKAFNDENDCTKALAKKRGHSKDRDFFFEMEEYRDDIFTYLREHEMRHRAKPGYILKQPDVTENMRSILVDWLVEVAEEYKMHTETLYLAVNFIDRFLSYMSVVRNKLQLVGTAAMFIAAKFEEIFPPPVTEFVYITDDTYDQQQVIRMEQLILRVLSFDLSIPTPLTFINAICTSARLTEQTMYLAMYLSELSLLEVEPYLRLLPSVLAASSIALARHTLGEPAWSEKLQKITGYALNQLQPGIRFLNEMFIKAPSNPQHAIQDKYKSSKYLKVSTLKPRSECIRFD